MVRVGIVGISGYTGLEVLEILLKHPQVRITYLGAQSTTASDISEVWPHLRGKVNLPCVPVNLDDVNEQCDVVFLAVPHTSAMDLVPALLKMKKLVIDLSADYRLRKVKEYELWYKHAHKDPRNISKAVYGLPELFRERIKRARLVANPGCYPTAAILGLAPLTAIYAELINSIVIDAKSGVSGAGRKASTALMFSEANENFKAYKVLQHQHAPEINQCLSKISEQEIDVAFVAHLLPITRGILETIYVSLDERLSESAVFNLYNKFYKTEPFVRILPSGQQPEIRNVVKTNFCDIGIVVDPKKKLIVLTSVIDNLTKGAGGQAVQNMNICCGFPETEALI